MIKRMSNKYTLNRVYSVTDISLMIVFLMSEKPIWITVQEFSVDGKMTSVVK
tara:strand:- start:564 stop:719 length:156 start_codon:yes stop_codon:yes gene_type:complete